MQMRNGNDKNFICANLIDDPVWKAVEAVTSCALPNGVPCVGKIDDLANTSIELVEKLLPKTFSSRLIPGASVLGLSKRRGRNAHLHDLRG